MHKIQTILLVIWIGILAASCDFDHYSVAQVVTLGLSCNCKSVVTLGDDINVTVRISNLDKQDNGISFNKDNRPTFYIFLYEMINGRAAEVQRTGEGELYYREADDENKVVRKIPFFLEGHACAVRLPPLSQKFWTFDLKKMFIIDHGGEYAVLVQRKIDGSDSPVLIGDATSFVVRK
jgi:hypothetical protein